MILILRQIADMLWEYKEVHIIVGIIFMLVLFRSLLLNGIGSVYQFKVCFYILLVIMYVTNILLLSLNIHTILPYFKLVSSLLVIVYGMLDTNPIRTLKGATYLSILLVLINISLALSGSGFKQWGDSNTFAGLYYFKTDLALAMCISLSLIIVQNWLNYKIKLLLVLFCVYLIFISNARAYYIITFFIIVIYFNKNNLTRLIYYSLPIAALSLVVISVISYYLSQFLGPDMLQLDLTIDGFYSVENTQGRSEIWEAVLGKFFSLDYFDQLTGIGLDGDVTFTTNALDNELAGLSAHNGYIYILISTGWIGIIVFLSFLVFIFQAIIKLTKTNKDKENDYIVLLAMMHTVIYLLSNISNPNIIFQQESWFFMYLVGCILKMYKIKSSYRLTVSNFSDSRTQFEKLVL